MFCWADPGLEIIIAWCFPFSTLSHRVGQLAQKVWPSTNLARMSGANPVHKPEGRSFNSRGQGWKGWLSVFGQEAANVETCLAINAPGLSWTQLRKLVQNCHPSQPLPNQILESRMLHTRTWTSWTTNCLMSRSRLGVTVRWVKV